MASSPGEHVIDTDWENLISWLEMFDPNFRKTLCVYSRIIPGSGRGLFVNRDVAPNTPLFTIPSIAYLNASTLSTIYERFDHNRKLSAVQLISLHLYLHRPDTQNTLIRQPDCGRYQFGGIATYGPYLAILPQNFASHPLSWLVLDIYPALLSHISPAVQRALHKMLDRFQEDWKAVSAYLDCLSRQSSNTPPPSFISWRSATNNEAEADLERYLWAWLNVNTRSFYMQLNPAKSDPDNITLCPLTDLANHSSFKQQTTSKLPLPTFYSPSTVPLRKDDEIYLRYGSHSNLTLFAEYGFVEEGTPNGGQADVQDVVEARFKALGDMGSWMKSLLENVNFWGDWFLYDSPPPASPSYRILPALRLLQLVDSLSSDIILAQDPFALSKDLQAWKDTVSGEREVVSESNESAVWNYIASICDLTSVRAHKGLEALHTITQNNVPIEWYSHVVECIRQLWLEELHVAEAVARSIKSGEVP